MMSSGQVFCLFRVHEQSFDRPQNQDFEGVFASVNDALESASITYHSYKNSNLVYDDDDFCFEVHTYPIIGKSSHLDDSCRSTPEFCLKLNHRLFIPYRKLPAAAQKTIDDDVLRITSSQFSSDHCP